MTTSAKGSAKPYPNAAKDAKWPSFAAGNSAAGGSALTSYATKALLITDLSVVRDAARTSDPCSAVAGDENKVWTLGRLLKKEAEKNGKTANDYIKNWLDAWATTATVNGQSFTPILSAVSGPTVRAN